MSNISNQRVTRIASLVGAGIVVASAMAQQAVAPQEVTVIAERATGTVVSRSSTTRAPIEVLELRHRVLYADLNLASSEGANAFRKRVQGAAKAACAELEKLYPFAEHDAKCAEKTDAAARPQVDAAIAAAAKAAK